MDINASRWIGLRAGAAGSGGEGGIVAGGGLLLPDR